MGKLIWLNFLGLDQQHLVQRELVERHNIRGDGVSGRGKNTVVMRRTILTTGFLSEIICSINPGNRR